MEQTITRFVHALRNAEVEVSPAESLDAFRILSAVGISDLGLFKRSLSLALAKTPADKSKFTECFDRFFGLNAFLDPAKKSILRNTDSNALIAELEERNEEAARVIKWVVDHDITQLNARLFALATQSGLYEIQFLRDKGSVTRKLGTAFGVDALRDLQADLQGDQRTGVAYLRQYLVDEIKNFVDGHYDFIAAEPAKQVLRSRALAAQLNQIPKDYETEVQAAVKEFAEQLHNKYRKHRRRADRGNLDVSRMLRKNMPYDGAMMELAFKQKRKEEGTLYLVCDVSGSVAQISKLMLLVTHFLHDLLPKVRSFAFSNELGEISDYFGAENPEEAIERVLLDWAGGNTDYGRAFTDFRNLVHQDMSRRSTLIVLGDARSNFYPARAKVFKDLSHRVKRTLWLNPEPKEYWQVGDSDMLAYAPFCSDIERVSTLAELRSFTKQLVQTYN
ncbi:MAG: VWA domain-containing protein [Pseudomonadales bacterium]|nr:VWA domain-containing protein [Pseudomonadales bacterium]